MTKFERIIRLPAIVLSRRTAEQIAAEMHELAERRVSTVLADMLRTAHQQQGNPLGLSFATLALPPGTEEEYIAQNVDNEAYRSFLRPTYGDKYTFLCGSGNVQFLYEDFTYEDIPPDVDLVLAEAGGPAGEILALSMKARTQPVDLADPNQNRILIQGPDRAWVNDTYERLRVLIDSGKEPARHVVYHWMPAFVWLTFLAALVVEYKLIRLFTGYDWKAPLNGLQLLLAFGVLAITLLLAGYAFVCFLPFVFPYFEMESNLSRRRIWWRRPVLAAISVLYAAAVTMLFAVR